MKSATNERNAKPRSGTRAALTIPALVLLAFVGPLALSGGLLALAGGHGVGAQVSVTPLKDPAGFSASAVLLRFASVPQGCGTVVMAGSSFASGASARWSVGVFPISVTPCAGEQLSGITVSGAGSLDSTQALLTVHGDLVVLASFAPVGDASGVGSQSPHPYPGTMGLGTPSHCHGNMTMPH